MKEEQRKSVLKLMREAKESKDDQRVKDIREAIICLGDSNRDRMAIAWDLSNFLQGGLAEGKAFGCICKSAKI